MSHADLFFIQQAGMLMNMPRSHNRTLGTTFDTVASHSFHVGVLSYVLCRMEGLTNEDSFRGLAMGVFHDVLEARVGDQDFISKKYTKADEEQALKDLTKRISYGDDLKDLITEWKTKETPVAQCSWDADSLQQVYQEWVLLWQGNKLAERWYEFDLVERVPNFLTASAKEIVKQMSESHPHEWWWEEFVDSNFNVSDLNG